MAEIKFQDKRIFYAATGSGPAVVLLHGFGENGNVFSNQVEFLKKDYRVIVPDLPGSGQSEMLDGDVSLGDFADIISAIMDKESPVEKFNLFGHSMGGYTTMAFVEKYANRLQTFGLIHSSSFADTPEKVETRKKAIEFIKNNGGRAFLKTIIPDLFSEESKKSHPEYINQLLDLTTEITDEALIQYYGAMIKRTDRSAYLKLATLPVLFIIGEYDNVIPLDISLKQCHLPAVSSVHILEHSGHLGMWEESDKTNVTLKNFLDTFL